MSAHDDYPVGLSLADHIAHDMRKGRFPKQSTLETFLSEREIDRLTRDMNLIVRPLEWVEQTGGLLRAKTVFDASYWVNPHTSMWLGMSEDWAAVNDPKAAAQADYTRRILSCIDTDALRAVVEALEPFAKEAERRPWLLDGSVNEDGPIGGSSLINRDLRAALTALGGKADG